MSSQNIQDLMGEVAQEGGLSGRVAAQLTNASTVAQIQKGAGVTPETYKESEVLIVTVLVDDSGSNFQRNGSNPPNALLVREGQKAIVDALKATKKRARIVMGVHYLNGEVLCPYVYLDQVPMMDEHNFVDGGKTPLFDQTFVTIGGVMAKVKEFEDAGISVQSWTLVVTDGADYGSVRSKPKDVAELVGTLNSEAHQVLAMGVEDGSTDFRAVFASMGIASDQILKCSELRNSIFPHKSV